jgi:hypothetical protein
MTTDPFVKSIFDNRRICMACYLYAPYFVLSAYPLVNSILDNILMCFFICMYECALIIRLLIFDIFI